MNQFSCSHLKSWCICWFKFQWHESSHCPDRHMTLHLGHSQMIQNKLAFKTTACLISAQLISRLGMMQITRSNAFDQYKKKNLQCVMQDSFPTSNITTMYSKWYNNICTARISLTLQYNTVFDTFCFLVNSGQKWNLLSYLQEVSDAYWNAANNGINQCHSMVTHHFVLSQKIIYLYLEPTGSLEIMPFLSVMINWNSLSKIPNIKYKSVYKAIQNYFV